MLQHRFSLWRDKVFRNINCRIPISSLNKHNFEIMSLLKYLTSFTGVTATLNARAKTIAAIMVY